MSVMRHAPCALRIASPSEVLRGVELPLSAELLAIGALVAAVAVVVAAVVGLVIFVTNHRREGEL
jgi:hypothetical protein